MGRNDVRGGRVTTLDAIRGIAAVAVVCYHMKGVAPFVPFGHGYVGVDVFFVLSGYVLVRARGAGLADGSTTFPAFMGSRLRRLMPMVWIGLAIGTATVASTQGAVPRLATVVAMNAAMVPLIATWAPGYNVFPLMPPAWSLLTELVANAAWVPLARRVDGRTMLALCAAAGGILLAAGCLEFGSGNFGATPGTVALGLARVAYGFPVGIALHALRHRLPAVAAPASYALLALLLSLDPPARWGAGWDLASMVLASSAVVALGARARGGGSATGALAAFGAALSYPLYATRGMVTEALGEALRDSGAGTGAAEVGAASILGATIVLAQAARMAESASRSAAASLLAGIRLRVHGRGRGECPGEPT